MKNILFLISFVSLLSTSKLLGQTSTTGKYYYAEVQIQVNGYGTIKSSSISFGVDHLIPVEKKDEIINKVTLLKSGTDIKNYLSDLGWEYVDIQNMNMSGVLVYTFRKPK